MAELTLADIDLVAVLVAALAYTALGFVWYHPKVFGTKWAELVGRSPEEMGKGAGPAYGVATVGAIVAALALDVLVIIHNQPHWVDGLGIGALVGVGFLVPVLATQSVFGGRPMGLYFLDVTYHILGFMLMGVILATML
jgi:hypothetical protein